MKRRVSGKQFQYIIIIALSFLIVVAFTGYKFYFGSPKQRAQIALERLLSCTLKEAEDFESMAIQITENAAKGDQIGMTQDDGSLRSYFEKQFGEFMTDACIEDLMEKRNFYRGAALAEKFDSDIEVDGIELVGRTEGKKSYNFSAELKMSGGDSVATVSGTISMKRDGMNWVANRITMTVK